MGIVYSPFSEVPYPDEDAAYDVPAHLSALVNAADTKMQGVAYSTSDRDSKFFNAPAGFLAKVVNSPSHPTNPNEFVGLYVKTGKAGYVTWYKLYEVNTTFTETNLQLVDGFDYRDPGFPSTVLRENENFAVLNGAIVKSDASKIQSGNVVAYLPPSIVPYRTSADYACATTYHTSAQVGSYKLSIFQGTRGITYYGPDVNWVGFDGIRFRVVN